MKKTILTKAIKMYNQQNPYGKVITCIATRTTKLYWEAKLRLEDRYCGPVNLMLVEENDCQRLCLGNDNTGRYKLGGVEGELTEQAVIDELMELFSLIEPA